MNKHQIRCKVNNNFAINFLLLIFIIVFAPTFSDAVNVESSGINKQSNTVTLNVSKKPLNKVLSLIEKQTEYVFVYNSTTPNINKNVSVRLNKASITNAMVKILEGTELNYEISGRQILIFQSQKTQRKTESKEFKVSGVVVDKNNEPLTGVNVREVKGIGGTVTDVNGHFTFNVQAGEQLEFSFIGFKSVEVKASNNMHIQMNEDNEMLNEVVVIGYGTMKKKDLTGAISGVSTKDFNKGMISNATELLQGRVTGVNITNNGGEPGAGVTIRVRGSNSIRSGQNPLYVVDGVPLNISDDQQPAGGSITGVGSTGSKNPLEFINPDDIERIDILKDASALRKAERVR